MQPSRWRARVTTVDHDAVIVGASFAGLACATTLASRGASVTVMDGKREAGEKLHTTGLLVRDALDQLPLLDGLPAHLVRRIDQVRLYAPSLRYIDLASPGYYFLATDTAGLMRWLAERASKAGARMLWGCRFKRAWPIASGFDLGASYGSTRVLVGADGPRSTVARSLGLGLNSQFLAGIEHEYTDAPIPGHDRLHCFIDRRCMPGYIGWVLQGVGVTQVGLARRQAGDDNLSAVAAMERFLDKIAPLFDFRARKPAAVRAGLIPCGGVVHPVARPRTLLVGDAAGMVSPLTAGGIHMALQHGARAGHVIADFLSGRGDDPGVWAARTYPRLRIKRALRFLFDRWQSDWAFDLLISSAPMRRMAGLVYFHQRSIDSGTRARVPS
jgi:flavin-dependent dehydrogenase